MVSLIEHARRELQRARTERDPAEARLARRQAAEKAWRHACQELSRVLNIGTTGPEAHHERKDFLGRSDREAGTDLLGTYETLEHRLHGDRFYEGRCEPTELEWGIQAAAELPERVRQALRRVGP